MLLVISLIVLVSLLAGGMIVMYIDLKKVKLDRGKMREDFVEFEQALNQAREYKDKEGWIAIKWVDRDNWFQGGSR